jgi:hypothetical protein
MHIWIIKEKWKKNNKVWKLNLAPINKNKIITGSMATYGETSGLMNGLLLIILNVQPCSFGYRNWIWKNCHFFPKVRSCQEELLLSYLKKFLKDQKVHLQMEKSTFFIVYGLKITNKSITFGLIVKYKNLYLRKQYFQKVWNNQKQCVITKKFNHNWYLLIIIRINLVQINSAGREHKEKNKKHQVLKF